MESKIFGFSLKNIPIANNNQYLKSLINKVESFVTRMRWKAIFFLQKNDNDEDDEDDEDQYNNYGFKSSKTPQKVNELQDFEDDLYRLISSIEFNNKKSNELQKKTKE